MPGEQSVSIVGGSILQLNQGGYSAFHKNSGWKKSGMVYQSGSQ
jgi:hypothetical protein